ncbi:MAG: hypothetical protein U1E69_13125 [Tabrizicola sp.]|uniref:hypothetical protein n=1 Tax=Tabrizicola sp. TaxID=2005166 RepID=UPI002ABCDE2C|nr:hypothetical protein [Tabrizicola sp.]MDZ4087729.1 hypothetical protein [Tabrizicola sp.]
MSLRIFLHSLRQVFGNLSGALRVSGVLMLVQFAVFLTLGRSLPTDEAGMRQLMMQGEMPWGRIVLSALVSTVLWLWIIVGWHRYILLNEQPRLVPTFRLDRMLGYFGKSLLVGLILLPLALILGFVGGSIASGMVQGGGKAIPALVVMGLIVYVPVSVVGMRLGTMLPGAALEPGVPVFSGWEATRGATLTILGVMVLSVGFSLVLEFVGMGVFGDPRSVPSLIYELVRQWIIAMVGASILTTLYGHYVEKRPLV